MREFLRISWQLVERKAVLLEPLLSRLPDLKGEQSRRGVEDTIERIVRRGQKSGDFDRTLPAEWLVRATHSLGHTAAEDVVSGRLSVDKAARLLERSILALYGVPH
jgi:hypothetical protein